MSRYPAAVVRQRRRLADGKLLVQVHCPVCTNPHWLREAPTAACLRRPGVTFPVRDVQRQQNDPESAPREVV
jgi:hypothetical protein